MDVWFKNTRPNIIYLKLIDEIFALIHKSIPSDQTEQQDVVKMLDIVIPTNLPKLVEEFDPATGVWRKLQDLEAARSSAGVAVTQDGLLLVLGGQSHVEPYRAIVDQLLAFIVIHPVQ